MLDKKCKYCGSEMVEQFVIDPKTNERVEQLQCFHCGHSSNESITEE